MKLPAPQRVQKGELLDVLAQLAPDVLPRGARLTSAQEYPDIHAAMAIYVVGTDAYALSIQRPAVPAPIEDMSVTGTATSTVLETGSTQVSVVGPDYEQAVIVRESGLTITVSRTGTDPAPATVSATGRSAAASLGASLAEAVDSDDFETYVP